MMGLSAYPAVMRYVVPTLAILCTGAAAQTTLSYAEFVARADALQAGATRAEIVAALGKPDAEKPAHLGYSLAGLVKSLPVGTTSYYAAEFDLKDGRMVGAVKWAWMDTTGMAPAPAKPR
jgi:hypothetical protein